MPGPGTRRVVFVGNNWDGTADLLGAADVQAAGAGRT